jgi:plasmid stabilization system protein ParE
LIPFSRRAIRQIAELHQHHEDLDRPEAFSKLIAALREASAAIERNPATGLPAPRAVLQLMRPGQAWVKAGIYWIAYRPRPQPVIVAVFYETANIPRRL